MFQKMEKLQQIVNGPEGESFREFYYGKFFTGTVTLIDGDEKATLSFHQGKIYVIASGIPDTGVDIGVSGTTEAWDAFCGHKSLTVASSRVSTDADKPYPRLAQLGGIIRVRQNFNPLAQLCRLYAGIR